MNLTFHTRFVLHQHTYLSEKVLDTAQLGLGKDSWLIEALKAAAKKSELQGVLVGEFLNLQRGLPILTRLLAWKKLPVSSLEGVEVNDLIRLFQHFENALIATENLTETVKGHTSAGCRRLITDYIRRLPGATALGRVKVLFKTKLNAHYPNRGLISDLPFDDQYPLEAMPHKNIDDLKNKTLERLQRDVDLISAACVKDLQDFELVCQKMESRRAIELKMGRASIKRFEEAATKEWKLWKIEAITGPIAKEDLLTYYLQTPPRKFRSGGLTYPFGSELKEILVAQIGYGGANLDHMLKLDLIGTTRELLACLLLIQFHTGWNVNSVLMLKDSDIQGTATPYRIQSIKTRTADHTPVSFVEQGDKWVLYALMFLRKRLMAMKRLNLVLQSEDRLWVNPYLRTIGTRRQYVGWGGTLRQFIARYNLPKFSLEQVRNQVLALTSQGKTGIQGAQHLAGHTSISTTGHYIDSMLLRRLNSAINLEFQRRLEASTILDFRSAESQNSQQLTSMPIGDGTTCVDPREPPHAEMLEDAICRGLDCHTGDGCPNRQIVINAERLEEIARTAKYYKSNWTYLANSNPDAFHRHHLPSMILNFGLQKLLEQGPYRHLYRRVLEDVSK